MGCDLYRPLGRDRAPPPVRRFRPSFGQLCLGVAVAAGCAGSTAIALTAQDGRRTAEDAETRPTVVVGRDSTHTGSVAAAGPAAREDATPTVFEGGADGIRQRPARVGTPPDGPAEPVTFRVEEPGSLRQEARAADRPDPALVEESAFGPLPTRAADGRRPLDVYAGEATMRSGPRVAIVVGGIGMSQTGSMRAVRELPAAVTLGFAAPGNSLKRWMREARQAGHELLLQVPLGAARLAPAEGGSKGRGLTIADARQGRFDALFDALGRMTNYVGVMKYRGDAFSRETPAMTPLLSELDRRGLMYLDDASTRGSVARSVAESQGVPAAVADVRLDRARSAASIESQLDSLERIARAEGQAVGVASAFDASITAIGRWAREARRRGIRLVPASAIVAESRGR